MFLFPLMTYWMWIQVLAASLPASPSDISRRERSRRYVIGGWR